MHLSDLHLGNDIVLRSALKLRSWRKRTSQRITDGLAASISELRPDYIVISGDFVNKAKRGTFLYASKYIRELLSRTQFNFEERLLTVPGNHDVSFMPRKHSDDFERLYRYRRFLQGLFRSSQFDDYRARYFRIDPRARLIFLCLDSTLKEANPGAEGQIGRDQLKWVRAKLGRLVELLGNDYSHFAKIAILHHHCKGIARTPVAHDRLMQLLDAEDVLKLFHEAGVNIVLHGHRHVPRVTPEIRSDSGWMTIIGAGTATCCFPEEQHTHGNNFNLIRVATETNEVEIKLFRADENGVFKHVGKGDQFPLFKSYSQGYSTREIRKVVRLERNGLKQVMVLKRELRVEVREKKMHALHVQILTDVASSKITDFDYDRKRMTTQIRVSTDSVIEGDFVFSSPLIFGGPPIDVSYSYKLEGGTAMSIAELAALYPSSPRDHESTSVVITQPTELLRIEVVFPDGFPTQPHFELYHLGAQVPINVLRIRRSSYDKPTNMYSLEIEEPPPDHTVFVKWTLPQSWP